MAQTLGYDDDERMRRIELVGDYYFNTPDASVRSTASYFCNNMFKISTATVSSYIALYKKKHSNETGALQEVLESRKPQTIDSPEVRERIANEVVLLKRGYTVEEISDMTGVEYWTVYRDFNDRLPNIDEKVFQEVKDILDFNRHSHKKK